MAHTPELGGEYHGGTKPGRAGRESIRVRRTAGKRRRGFRAAVIGPE
jgi:hypothetical protein